MTNRLLPKSDNGSARVESHLELRIERRRVRQLANQIIEAVQRVLARRTVHLNGQFHHRVNLPRSVVRKIPSPVFRLIFQRMPMSI
jgi:hypothetical protein